MSLLSQRRAARAAPSAAPEGALRLVDPGNEPEPARPRLGALLVERGTLAPGDLLKALAMQGREDARLGEILIAHRMITPDALMEGLAEQWQARIIDPVTEPPDPRLIDLCGPARCLREAMLPWQRHGAVTVIATARPHLFARHEAELTLLFGPVVMALARESQIFDAVERLRAAALTRRAETRVAPPLSCRAFLGRRRQRARLAVGAVALAAAFTFPVAAVALLTGWAVFTLLLLLALKAAAVSIGITDHLRERHDSRLRRAEAAALVAGDKPLDPRAISALPGFTSRRANTAIARLPVVSVMVPIFHEEEIATRLVRRLSRLAYPKELLDIVLVMEDEDDTTRQTLARTRLPPWMRVVTVPRGAVQTKPRALNYALEFCRGTIVGVWDAEDAPEPQQIHKVVQRFHERPAEVACLQGALDFYNSRTNWLSRCFAVEYASWFRVVLPGLARLGLAIPLGGTTLFFRRAALERIGGWDAHNVTEDADLGIRLARMGYRAELVSTTTFEEANCRALPWIRQRSRWIKGYAMTWAVHMRSPARLWRELGAWRFAGFQLLFVGTLSQFILAPLIWSFWLVVLGFWHPVAALLPGWAIWALASTFFASELVNIATGLLGAQRAGHLALRKWVPTLHLYHPLGALASYKALWEIATRPFYWDKTAHGLHDAHEAEQHEALMVRAARATLTPAE